MLILNVLEKQLKVILLSVILIFHTQENVKIIFLAVLLIRLFVLTINSVKKLFFTEEKKLFTNSLNQFLVRNSYCRKVIKKKHFNKNLVTSAEEEERFQLSNICWICNRLFDVADEKI